MVRFLSIMAMALVMAIGVYAQSGTTSYDIGMPIGWATVGGNVTGGSGGETVTVTTFQEFDNAMLRVNGKKDTEVKRIIYVKGDIFFSTLITYNGVKNKTIIGLPGASFVNMDQTKKNSGILKFTNNCQNIILRNMTFKGPGAYDVDGNDNLLIQEGHYFWVDHCDFQDGVDGNFDINNGSDHIAVTWCRFRYLLEPKAGGSGGANDHRYSNLIGSSDSSTKDPGHLNVTFANCWWDVGCMERCPRVRFGKVHVLNCLFTNEGYNYCFGTGIESNIYVEKCHICEGTSVYKNPGKSGTTYNITITDCIGANDVRERVGTNDYFIPSNFYAYTSMDKALVKEVVGDEQTGAGATLDVHDGQGESSSIELPSQTLHTEYFDAAGIQQSRLKRGFNILRKSESDGSVRVIKMLGL
ncbi:MAG: chromophore lyase [Prevotella sp.]|nr:chromophore lyase [Prevotella sp.]